jgi:hypothetical protein
MCGRVKCRVDPKILMAMLGVTGIKNAEKYRPSYNKGPMQYLPIAYMKWSGVEAKERDEFQPNFDDEEEEEGEVEGVIKTSEEIVNPIKRTYT